MRCFWELESSGIRSDEIDSGMKDKEGLRGFNESVQLVEIDIVLSCRGKKARKKKTCETLLKSFWVDYLAGGIDQVERVVKITTESVGILKNVGMVLRKWQINSVKLREAWRRAGIETQEDETIKTGSDAPTKVLELTWDPNKDMIFFVFSKLINILANGAAPKDSYCRYLVAFSTRSDSCDHSSLD
ncbi:integrase catalytic domain-containing protein [Nephila pilipes]|uniref:Integrase catalytic domain-containing protein n=1 Tax=Nephila pilipes TaxID=299642 RepID=A0A8X6NHU1_NEPPI|nr:integrase catalytic domain-containing protein [Nephila pilipes]